MVLQGNEQQASWTVFDRCISEWVLTPLEPPNAPKLIKKDVHHPLRVQVPPEKGSETPKNNPSSYLLRRCRRTLRDQSQGLTDPHRNWAGFSREEILWLRTRRLDVSCFDVEAHQAELLNGGWVVWGQRGHQKWRWKLIMPNCRGRWPHQLWLATLWREVIGADSNASKPQISANTFARISKILVLFAGGPPVAGWHHPSTKFSKIALSNSKNMQHIATQLKQHVLYKSKLL